MQGYYIVTETIKAQLELDPFVNTVNTGIIEDVLLKKADMYPYSHILVNNSSYQGNTWMFNLSVICMDIVDLSKDEVTEVFYGNDNQQDVLNTQLAVINRMLDILQRGQNTKSYILDGAPNCEPFIDRFEHGVAGWTVTFDIRIPNTMTVCSTDVEPVKLCPDFTYLIKDSADNTLYTGSILSGNGLTQTITDGEVTNTLGTVLGNVLAQGSLELSDVNNIDSDGSTVPTPVGVPFTCTPIPPCEDATYSIEDSALNVLYSGSIVSGGNLNQTITDGSIVLQDTASTIISTTSIEAQGTAIVTAPDSSYNVEYLDGSPIESGYIVSGGSKLVQVANPITCADATVENSDLSYSATVASGGTLVVPDTTDVIKNSAGTTLYTNVIPSTTTNNQVISDSTAVLKNTLGTTLITETIPAQASEDITAPDATVENSDATYSVLVPSGSTVIMPNINFTDSDGITTSVPSNKDITATLCGGGASISTATLMRTGATTSYRTGDDADRSSEGRATDFFTLAENNPFGNTDRFTDELGTQTYADDIVIDWSTYNGATVLGYYRIRGTYNDLAWNDAIDNSLLFTKGTYTTGWRLPNFAELVSLVNYSGVRPIDYAPFNFTSNLNFWSSTTVESSTTSAYVFSNNTNFSYVTQRIKTNTSTSYRAIPCRTFTVTGTTLT